MSEASPMDDPDSASSDLLFAWLSPIETHVDQRMQRPKSPSIGSPLVRAKTAITGFKKRTFSGGLNRQDYRQRGEPTLGSVDVELVNLGTAWYPALCYLATWLGYPTPPRLVTVHQ